MSEAAKRAAELANAESAPPWSEFDQSDFGDGEYPIHVACRKYIRHVSDVAKRWERHAKICTGCSLEMLNDTRALILPDPVSPLAEVFATLGWPRTSGQLEAALKARGLQITPIGDGV